VAGGCECHSRECVTRVPCGRANPCSAVELLALQSRPRRDGLRGGGRGRAPALPVLLRAVDQPTAMGGPVRPRRRPVPPHGAGLPRPQGAPAPRARLRRILLLAAAALLLRPPRRRAVPQLQVSGQPHPLQSLRCAVVL
jgi:hypothetical protein